MIALIDRQMLGWASRLMSKIYIRFSVSPRRQVPIIIVIGSIIELLVFTFATSFMWVHGALEFLPVFLLALVSIGYDGASALTAVGKVQKGYGLNEYRVAYEGASEDRDTSRLLRGLVLAIICGLVLLAVYRWSWDSPFLFGAATFFAAYGARFFFRACEPPAPVEALG